MPAKIRVITVNGTKYVQAVTYHKPKGSRKSLKVLKSFGARTVFSLTEAKLFARTYNVIEAMRDDPNIGNQASPGDVETFSCAVAGPLLGFKVLKYLFD